MAAHVLQLSELKKNAVSLRAGDSVLLSGTLYTARDAAHKRIVSILDNGGELPFCIDGAVIYYAGPTPTPPGRPIGSCGPTTSSRMDVFTPRLLGLGLAGVIGKGNRSPEVEQAFREHGAVYLCAIGGAGAVISASVISLREIAFPELGCESVKELTVRDFPAIVAYDQLGGSVFSGSL